jgi:hypothetical protein
VLSAKTIFFVANTLENREQPVMLHLPIGAALSAIGSMMRLEMAIVDPPGRGPKAKFVAGMKKRPRHHRRDSGKPKLQSMRRRPSLIHPILKLSQQQKE